MIFLITEKDLSHSLVHFIEDQAATTKCYFPTVGLYQLFRKQGLNVDLCFFKDNMVYLVDGQVDDTIPILTDDVCLVESLGNNCSSMLFKGRHNISNLSDLLYN